jgi:hypothetical protein
VQAHQTELACTLLLTSAKQVESFESIYAYRGTYFDGFRGWWRNSWSFVEHLRAIRSSSVGSRTAGPEPFSACQHQPAFGCIG